MHCTFTFPLSLSLSNPFSHFNQTKLKIYQEMKTRHPYSDSAEIIFGNEDLLTEILLRIPAEPLVKLKSVSKTWLSIVTCPHFSIRHTRLHSNSLSPAAVLLRSTPTSLTTHYNFLSLQNANSSGSPCCKALDFVHDPAGIKILQSCNGLLLCCSSRKIEHHRNYYVYNPTTEKFVMLPKLGDQIYQSRVSVYGVSLAFDPSRSPYYKVLCVRSTVESIYLYQIEIYESSDRRWRLSGSPFEAPFDMVFDSGVFWNGGIHWVSPTGASLCFDVENECSREMPKLPVSEDGRRSSSSRRFRYFGESCGHVHFFEIYGSRTTHFKVFEMEKDYSGWSVKYNVELDSIVNAFPEMVRDYMDPGDMKYYAFVMLLLVRDVKDEDSSLVIHVPGKILSHNVSNKTFKLLYEIPAHRSKGHGSLQYGWLDAYEFVHTLASI